MTERDHLQVFCRRRPAIRAVANTSPLWLATINNHRQRLAAHGDKGLPPALHARFPLWRRHPPCGRFASGVDMGQLRHTYFFKCGWKLHGRVRASSCGAMIFSHAVRHALVEPGSENQRFVGDARYRTRLQRGSANLFKRQHTEHFTKNLQFHGRTTAAMLREPDHLPSGRYDP